MMGDLFVVLSYGGKAPLCASVVKLETPPDPDPDPDPVVKNESAPPEPKRLLVNLQDMDHIVARFSGSPVCPPDTPRRLPEVRWLFSPPTVSTEDMYLVPDWESVFDDIYPCSKPPLQGYKFNFSNGECRPIDPPRVPKSQGHVVNLNGHIYFMAHPDSYYDTPDPVFECYDPDDGNSWKALQPFPDHAVLLGRCQIQATAVLNDTILYNMCGRRIWAYHVTNDKWYLVHVEDDQCYDIVGEAVVLDNNTVYALTDRFRTSDYVLALSIQREETDDDDGLVFTCSLRSAILVRGMGQIKYKRTPGFRNIRHLVHLGKDNFCLVQSCKFSNYRNANKYQPIQLTCLKRMGENSMTVTNTCVYEVEIQPENQFEVRLCFSLPEYKTTALKQGNRFLYNLDPCQFHGYWYKFYASKQEDKTDFNPEPEVVKPVQASTQGRGAASERSNNTAEDGHSIFVRNLPPDATVIELERKLKIFGSIKRDGIRVIIDKTPGNRRFSAYVEFESATSKRDAIEASSIVIQGCHAEIEDKREDLAPCCFEGDAAACAASKRKDKTDFNPKLEDGKPVQASTHGRHGTLSESSNTAQGHCILVTNLPPGATINQVARKVRKIAFFKRDGIRGLWQDGNHRLIAVCVKFESSTAKLNAIKGPGFKIRDHKVMITDCRNVIFSLLGGDLVSNNRQMTINKFVKEFSKIN